MPSSCWLVQTHRHAIIFIMSSREFEIERHFLTMPSGATDSSDFHHHAAHRHADIVRSDESRLPTVLNRVCRVLLPYPLSFLLQKRMATGAFLVADRTGESSHTLDACTGNVSCASEPHRSERCKVSHDVGPNSATVHDAHGSCSPFDSRPPCESHADGV